MRALRRVSKQWTILSKKDPFWAILACPEKRGGGWDQASFFETGVAEIAEVIQTAERFSPICFQNAVDFGCGVGRLSQALACRFERVTGIDIAEPMLQMAVRLNRFPVRCEYVLNVVPDLSAFDDDSVDFVYSNITLQHMVPSLARLYIREFFRIARPNAHVIFQLPSKPRSLAWQYIKRAAPVALSNLLWRLRTGSPEAMESYFIPERRVIALVEESRGAVAFIESNPDGPPGWESRRYFCLKV